MIDYYWIWSHGFKIHDDDRADPSRHRFSQSQLEAMSDMESIAAFLGRWKEHADEDEENIVERMAYIIKHGLEYERELIARPRPDGSLFKTYYVQVKMDEARAIEFKMRFYTFNVEKSG